VVVTRGSERATGDVAVYDFNTRIITMVGNVALRRGTDTLNGGRLVIDLKSGHSNIDGNASGAGSRPLPGEAARPGGRVSGSFSVPK
jgi:lipopolysaccharide export system protein LptA